MRRISILLVVALCLIITAACLPAPAPRQWARADLRWLGEANAPTPSTDLLAVYTHTNSMTEDIRVDLLDINPGDPDRIRFSLWDNRNFSNEPLVIELSPDGAVHTSSQAKGAPVVWPQVIRNFEMDTITISVNRFLFGDHFHLDVATYTPDTQTPADEARNVRSDGIAPVVQAPFLLEFWNTFPADTPAQALRRWDGAHTGPLGGRDGLKYILEAAKRSKVPLTLLDVKNPASLAALSYLDTLGIIRSMSEAGRLLLPEAAYAQPGDISLAFSRKAADGFSLPRNSLVYDPSGELHAGYSGQFMDLPDKTHLVSSSGMRFIPVPSAEVVEATEEGPSLEVRRALVAAMLSSDPADLVILGGSVPNSTWGQADMAAPTFQWLAGHPWIRALNLDDLMAFPTVTKRIAAPPPVQEPTALVAELRSAPVNGASVLAWQAFLALNKPSTQPELKAIQPNYLGQVYNLLEAARWAEHPAVRTDCSNTLEEGGGVICTLSDQSYFAQLDPQGGRLTTLFYKDGAGVHQLVGPSSQFAVGLSDPSEWDPQKGQAADPNVIPGAFADARETWTDYTFSVKGSGITFTSPDGKRVKTFQLTQAGIQVEMQLPPSEITRIPLAVEPLAFYSGPVDYQPSIGDHSWSWGLAGGVTVEVQTDATISAQGFVSSWPFLAMAEDPNLDYPSGHYMAFPLSVAVVQGEGHFKVEIRVK